VHPPSLPRNTIFLFGSAIFTSAFLLFSIQPLIAKRVLPWFGGSAAVWSTCLVFYQTALLLGYLYAGVLTRYLTPRAQSAAHVILLTGSLALLPIGPSEHWKPSAPADPAWFILALLSATIGLPFVALSATTPLLQSWLARSGFKTPYRFFALSNFASLAALLAYPLIIEPALGTSAQTVCWSVVYVIFVLLCAASAWQSRARRSEAIPADYEWSPPWRKAAWFSLASCGGMLLLSITNHIAQNVAAVPLLWVVPLAIYLLTFVLSFGVKRIYHRALWLRMLAFALGTLGYAIYDVNAVAALQVSLPIFLGGLFICCMFCHGELNRLRPHTSALTNFYLLIAAGGAAGAIFIGLIAPRIFSGTYELPVTLSLMAVLTILLTWRDGAWPVRLLWIAVAGCMVVVIGANVKAYRENSLSLRRSFYGSLRVVQSPHAGPQQTRTLFHGTIEHGAQFLWPPLRFHPTTYYGPDSGVGIVLREAMNGPKRVGLVGLGAGTLAAYGQAGDLFRFYEINPQVVDLAQSLFFYLRESRAQIQIVEGDARLSLEREKTALFDVLVLDAFSGDAIPVHLLTREAFALYRKHLRANGVLAFHVSNDYLDLAPVIGRLAREFGFQYVLVKSHANQEDLILPADWVLVTNNRNVLDNPSVRIRSVPIEIRPGLRAWNDDYNNLLQILKTPQFRRR
jgi:hypothetical protein